MLSYMALFGQCVKIPDDVCEGTWLVPSLLPTRDTRLPRLSSGGILEEDDGWAELTVRFMHADARHCDCEHDCECDPWPPGPWPETSTAGFLPDTLFFKLISRLTHSAEDVQDGFKDMYADWIVIHGRGQYYMVRYHRAHQLLRLHVQMASESAAAAAKDTVEAAINDILLENERERFSAHAFGLRFRFEALCNVTHVLLPVVELPDDHVAKRITGEALVRQEMVGRR